MNQYVICYRSSMARDTQVFRGKPDACEALSPYWTDIHASVLAGIYEARSEREALRLAAEREGCHPDALTVAFEQNELELVRRFAREQTLDTEFGREQLRCQWTAYCLHNELEVDTREYDQALMELWEAVSATETGPAGWNRFSDFDGFMCRFMV